MVTLGALIRDLARQDADDTAVHFGALVRFARQYLQHCKSCRVRCDPEKARCGYIAESTGRLRCMRPPRSGYVISGYREGTEPYIEFQRAGGTHTLFRAGGSDYHIDGYPPPVSLDEAGEALHSDCYASFLEGVRPQPRNLGRSFSGLCFAGRTTGERVIRAICASIRFRTEHLEVDLPSLLTIQGWASSQGVSRATFFNARTEKYDRYVAPPALIVADGDASFLKVLARPELQTTDVIGVIHKTIDRDALEAVGNRMLGLLQWYSEDVEFLQALRGVPVGMSACVLRRRDF